MSREDHRQHDRRLAELRQTSQPPAESNMISFSRNEFALLILGFLPAIGGLYSDDYPVKTAFVVLSFGILLVLCFVHSGSKPWRIGFGILCLVSCTVLVLRGSSRERDKVQDDVFSKMTVSPFLPTSRNLARVGVTVTNNGGSEIKVHIIRCWVNQFDSYPMEFQISNMSLSTVLPQKAGLKAFGDAETSYCASMFEKSNLPVSCLDMTVYLDYSLAEEPDTKKTRTFRFVMTPGDDQFHQQNIEYRGTYCPVPPKS
jgi:hypothetical protein